MAFFGAACRFEERPESIDTGAPKCYNFLEFAGFLFAFPPIRLSRVRQKLGRERLSFIKRSKVIESQFAELANTQGAFS